ncbi:oligosaccharyl transferase glycoprotein complex, beta subunit [Massospora cicadina]|nr:oligosaccharyl transferase glycoprotein complex, beta subunit [Massospora cicadina]
MRAASFFLAATLAGLGLALSSTGNRVLFLVDGAFSKEKYSTVYELLEGRGYEIKLEKATASDLSVARMDERLYDHLILFSPQSKVCWAWGDVMMVANPTVSDYYRRVGAQFGITFEEAGSVVLDPINNNATEAHNAWEYVVAHPETSNFISSRAASGGPILFQGIAHSISNTNPQITSLLKPSSSAYSSLQSSFGTPGLYGSEISLVSAHQSRNNARFTVFGSTEMFSDKFILSPVTERLAEGGQKTYTLTGNGNFIEDLVKWTFQEVGVIKSTGFSHYKVGESVRPANYRIRDEMIYSINLTEYRDGKWVAFEADDVQLEVTMLDPYIRATLLVNSSVVDALGNEVTNYQIKLTLPDVYGVFTFRVNYRRDGLSGILVEDVIPIHPFKHNEFPRFLLPAYPYYAATISMSAGFLVFSVIWLYNKDSGVLAKDKKA